MPRFRWFRFWLFSLFCFVLLCCNLSTNFIITLSPSSSSSSSFTNLIAHSLCVCRLSFVVRLAFFFFFFICVFLSVSLASAWQRLDRRFVQTKLSFYCSISVSIFALLLLLLLLLVLCCVFVIFALCYRLLFRFSITKIFYLHTSFLFLIPSSSPYHYCSWTITILCSVINFFNKILFFIFYLICLFTFLIVVVGPQ